MSCVIGFHVDEYGLNVYLSRLNVEIIMWPGLLWNILCIRGDNFDGIFLGCYVNLLVIIEKYISIQCDDNNSNEKELIYLKKYIKIK